MRGIIRAGEEKLSMTWARLAAGLLAAGIAGAAATAQAAPLASFADVVVDTAAPVQTVQYYYYDDYDWDYAPPPPRYRVYRQPPTYGYYPPQPRYYSPAPGYVERRREAVQDYRRAQKEIFKDRVRAWNRAHGF
jgi:hypothetical protein